MLFIDPPLPKGTDKLREACQEVTCPPYNTPPLACVNSRALPSEFFKLWDIPKELPSYSENVS